ncbi:MAG: hypothetical protein QME14_03895 [Methanobacteriaceae archaeon]|nr:hypothetical protein [Methanobacteriaceae archaeon]
MAQDREAGIYIRINEVKEIKTKDSINLTGKNYIENVTLKIIKFNK